MSYGTEDTNEWPEPTPLSEVLLEGLISERGRGRPKKGEEKTHEFDEQHVTAQDLLREAGCIPLSNTDPRGNVRIDKESTRHRVLLYLFAQGGTVRSVYESLGGQFDEDRKPVSGTGEYTYSYLCQIRKQPWFQQNLLELLDHEKGDMIAARLKLEAMASVETLIELRDNAKEKGAVRASAANSLLDRHLGKATQTVRTEATVTTASYENERIVLENRLAQIRQEQSNLNAAIEISPTV